MKYGHPGPRPASALRTADPAHQKVDPAPPGLYPVTPGLDVESGPSSSHAGRAEVDPVASGEDAAQPDAPPGFCGQASSAAAQRRIAQLLGDAVSHLISAGLDLASVRGRISRTNDQIELEHATNNLDAAIVDIRRLAVGIALGGQAQAKDD